MTTYIKIRELTPYADATGVFSGDMLALALDTTSPDTPHLIPGTQRATVDQVINSYNTTVANQTAAARAAGNTTTNNIIIDNNGQVVQDRTLTAATFGDFIQIGGGLEWNNPCLVNNAFIPGCDSKPTLSLASSVNSTTFYMHCSGGSTATEHIIESDGHVSGKFPTLKSAVHWANGNIASASRLTYLIETDLTEPAWGNESSSIGHSSNSIQIVQYMDFGLWQWAMNIQTGLNNGANWDAGKPGGYDAGAYVKYTAGDYNIYKSNVGGNGAPPTNSVKWTQYTPAMALGRSSYSRPLITVPCLVPTSRPYHIYLWDGHGGPSQIDGLKFKFTNLDGHRDNGGNCLFRRAGEIMTISRSEFYLESSTPQPSFRSIFEAVESAMIRTSSYGALNTFLTNGNNIPDPYGVTGSHSYCPIPSCYISLEDLADGLGQVFRSSESSRIYPANEYHAFYQRNGSYEMSRMQFGSGTCNIGSIIKGDSSPQVSSNSPICISPTTVIGATARDVGTYNPPIGQSVDAAPMALSQFASVNVNYHWASGDGTFKTMYWPGTAGITTPFVSGDSFVANYGSVYPIPSMDGAQLGSYIRYPD